MRVLITGGFGYVGGRLAQRLGQARGTRIVLGTRREATEPAWCPRAEVATLDWSSEVSLRAACEGVDAVVHLAGLNAQECSDDPVNALAINGVGTARLVRAAVDAGVRRMLHISTAHVYGSPLEGVVTEERCALAAHPYATSHRAGEDSVAFAHVQGRLEGTVLRLSNSFGPPAHQDVNCWMLLVNDLCRQAATSRRMELRSSGLQRRDFITLTDTCRAIEHFLNLPAGGSRHVIHNVGGEWSPTVGEMADRIAGCCREELGYLPELHRPAPQPGEHSMPSQYRIDRLRAAGFVPEARIDAEIRATLAFCNAGRKALSTS